MDELQAWAASLPPHEEIAPMDKIDTSTALLPCPFCGGEAQISTRTDECLWSHNQVEWTAVSCGGGIDFDCFQPSVDWPSSATDDAGTQLSISQWNRRALVPALSAENADLRAKLDAAVVALGNIDALDPEGMIDGCSPLAIKGFVLRMGEITRATLAKIKGADHE